MQKLQEVTKYPAGTFCWIDLATTDVAAATAFYTQLFGWQAESLSKEGDAPHIMFTLHGKQVAATYVLDAEQQAQSVPPNWLSHVAVDDIATAAARVGELGGTVLSGPFKIMDSGHIAVVQDPTGAVFSLWQPINHIGAQLVNIPGTLGWNELSTKDLTAATAFYTGLFGWKEEVDTSGPEAYHFFQNGDRAAAGMLQIQEEWGDVPASWTVYFMVDDCDGIAAKTQELGGAIIVPPRAIGDMGRFAVLQDPQGAFFTVARMDYVDPPPGYEAETSAS